MIERGEMCERTCTDRIRKYVSSSGGSEVPQGQVKCPEGDRENTTRWNSLSAYTVLDVQGYGTGSAVGVDILHEHGGCFEGTVHVW